MQICIFEGINYDRLEPLIYTRPAYDMICGINSLRKKILRAYPGTKYSLHCRAYLEHFVKAKNPGVDVNKIEDDKCLLINGRIFAPPNLAEIVPLNGDDRLYMNGEQIIAARVSGKKLKEVKENLYDILSESNFDGIPVEKVNVRYADYVWDFVVNNAKEIRCDFEQVMNDVQKDNIKGKVYEGAHLIEKENIFIGEGAVIKAGAVIDASNGPVYIDRDAVVASNAVVEGAVYLGEGSIIRSCARVYENVSIGQVCKIGGEVEDTIFLPFSNKQHSGFLGHAYIGSWVNIGADTNCSDLKNNYGSIKVYTNGEIIDSKLQFLGLIMGDHSKTAINTMFNTGTIVGFSCNIFGAGFPDKYIPSFSWGGSGSVTTYDIEKSIETARRMLQRRKKEISEQEEKLFRKIFDLTKKERRKRGYPY
jgi:UDP-N-acetylglucosamine diphosphorylase/glucosamine-1-phosphate N-acetyltransferase